VSHISAPFGIIPLPLGEGSHESLPHPYEENRQQLRQRFQEKDKNDRLTKIENNALKKKKSRNNIGGMNAFSLREPLYGTWFRSDTNFCN
jgi:hypothetical protein